METNIVLVDDHNLFREGLAELLASVPGFHIVGQGATGVDAITLAHSFRPDVILLDVELPGPGPVATIRRLTETNELVKVIILTMHDDFDLLIQLVEAGADGYLLKTAGRAELIGAITASRRNEDTVVVAVPRATLLHPRIREKQAAESPLSTRETEVMRLLQRGGSNKVIANDLTISEATVKRHLANVFRKLGASSRLDAIRKASDAGLL